MRIGDVQTRLNEDSVACRVEANITAKTDGVVEGRLDGEFTLAPKSLDEAGRRRNAASLFHSVGKLEGYFRYDTKKRAFTELKLVTKDVDHFMLGRMGPRKERYSLAAAIELLVPKKG